MKARDLQLGDVVRQDFGVEAQRGQPGVGRPWSTCIVIGKDEKEIELFRPYGVTVDFSMGHRVIAYTGIEQYKVEIDRETEWDLLERKTLK